MSDERLRTGVVGTGYLGRLHTRILTEIADSRLVGFVESDDQTAEEITASFSLPRFGSLEELAAATDCVVVATPTTNHFEAASVLLESGCDVMIEKPIAATVPEAEKLVSLAREKGKLIQVGHVERYNPAIVAVAPLLAGTRYIEAQRLGVFATRSLDIDVLLDLMIHDLNLVLSLIDSSVESVHAVGVPVLTEKVDIANVRLQMENGAVANLTASRVSSERVRKIRFFGHDSYISADTKEQDVKGYRLVEADIGKSIQPIDLKVERREPLRAELESFLSAVRRRSRPLVSGEDGTAALSLALKVRDAVEESMRS